MHWPPTQAKQQYIKHFCSDVLQDTDKSLTCQTNFISFLRLPTFSSVYTVTPIKKGKGFP